MKAPKLTNKEYAIVVNNKTYYHIKYVTPYGKGYMNIDTRLFEKIEDRFYKLFKDATILEFTKHKKGDRHWYEKVDVENETDEHQR